jgi:hypothetical protein
MRVWKVTGKKKTAIAVENIDLQPRAEQITLRFEALTVNIITELPESKIN